MSVKKIKMGVMGADRGRIVLMCEEFLHEEMEVTALMEKNETLLQSLREQGILKDSVKLYEDFDEFIHSGIDAVMLCNYFHEHTEYAIKAMEAGVAVLSETTAAPSLGECVKLVEAAEKTGIKYMLGANTLYFRVVREMKKIVDEKKYGEPVFADAEYVHPADKKEYIAGLSDAVDVNNLHWRNTLPRCYYNMHDLGPMMYIFGKRPKRVIGKAVVLNNRSSDTITDHEKAFALVEMEDGSVINYSGCTRAGSLGKWYRVACKYGTVESVRFNEAEDKIIENGINEPITRDLTWSGAGSLTVEEEQRFGGGSAEFEHRTHGGLDLILIMDFLKYLRGESVPPYDVYGAVDLSAVAIMAWYSALSDSKPMDIPDFRNKADRDKFRSDFRMPFAKRLSDVTLPVTVESGKGFKAF